jgi:TRAP-type mannitol/chloroaromatic compound transport system permease large subunit
MTVILQWLTTLTVADRIALFVGIGSIVIGVVAALAGAWFGSHSAFKLARRQQKQDLRDKRHSA